MDGSCPIFPILEKIGMHNMDYEILSFNKYLQELIALLKVSHVRDFIMLILSGECSLFKSMC